MIVYSNCRRIRPKLLNSLAAGLRYIRTSISA